MQEFLKEHNQVYARLQPDGVGNTSMRYKPVPPENVTIGENNEAAPSVNFRFALVSNYEARVQLTNMRGQNYSVAEEIYHRPV